MPYTKIAIHLVWSTKNREKIITNELKPKLLSHIKENAIAKSIIIDTLNCVTDHIHIIIFLRPNQKLSDVLMLIKGESSFWVTQNKLTKTKFEWQDDYFANSVSESNLDKVREYILNQEEHHKKKSFIDEYNELLKKYGFENK